MEMRKRIMPLAVLLLMVSFVISATPVAVTSGDSVPKISKPFEYSGYTFPQFTSFVKSSQYVTISDGVLIAVDVFLPFGYNGTPPAPTKFPVVFQYTPYRRATIDLLTGKISDASASSTVKLLLSYGYAIVVADIRGSGASFGWKMDFMPRIAMDGANLIDWIATRPWCDGNIGMMGGSYVGWSQMATAGACWRLATHREALKCIFPTVIPLDGYTGEVYPGGIYVQGFMNLWTYGTRLYDLAFFIPGAVYPAAPVVDEDGDGQLHDEIPLDLNANGMFVDDYDPTNPLKWPPKYWDGNGTVRNHIYYFAILQHALGNLIYAEWAGVLGFIDSQSPVGPSAYGLGPNAFVPAIMESGIPVYIYDGYFDGFSRGCIELYNTIKATNPSKMILSPGYHGLGPFWKGLGIPLPNFDVEHLRWFDRWLKGIENGIDKEPPIYIYVINGEGWRFEDAWPLPQQVMTNYYFEAGHTLATTRTTCGSDLYRANYAHDSRYGTVSSPFVYPGVGGNRWLSIGGMAPNELPWRTQKDLQCLVYTSAPLQQDMEVTGHPIVQFWVSSTADYGDFFVYLEDVNETGAALLISENPLRAEFASLYDNDEIIYSSEHVDVFGYDYGKAIDVLPELPWHGFEEAEYVDKILAGGNVVELKFDLLPISWVFKKGHAIRVSIACSDWPTFRLHEKLCPTNNPADPNNIVPTITIYRDAQHASHIQLPVIPPKHRVFEGYARVKTAQLTYMGPAELYTFETATYLHFEDQWIRWETKYHWQFGCIEIYMCTDELGTLWVRVVDVDPKSYALALGPKVFFVGSTT